MTTELSLQKKGCPRSENPDLGHPSGDGLRDGGEISGKEAHDEGLVTRLGIAGD